LKGLQMSSRRTLFYCQHLLGIGHLTRSLAICEKLLQQSEVDFIQGGPEAHRTIQHAGFHHHQLPPLLMNETSHELYDPFQQNTLPEIWTAREHIIQKLLQNNQYDVLVVELFPFGRNKFKKEILHIIE